MSTVRESMYELESVRVRVGLHDKNGVVHANIPENSSIDNRDVIDGGMF